MGKFPFKFRREYRWDLSANLADFSLFPRFWIKRFSDRKFALVWWCFLSFLRVTRDFRTFTPPSLIWSYQGKSPSETSMLANCDGRSVKSYSLDRAVLCLLRSSICFIVDSSSSFSSLVPKDGEESSKRRSNILCSLLSLLVNSPSK